MMQAATKVNGTRPPTESSSTPISVNSAHAEPNLEVPPVTRVFANFIASASPNALTSQLRDKVKECVLDFLAVTASGATTAPSSDPILHAITSLSGSTTTATTSNSTAIPASGTNGQTATTSSQPCTVLTQGRHFTPQYAALLNATFGHSLDFDDTHAEGTLHAGVTTIATALACAEALQRPPSSEQLLLAIAVGYEITCRLGIALGFAAYSRGFHNTSTAGIFGAVATIAVLRNSSADVIVNAFGLAGSKAAGSMQYLENGSWNKRLHPGFAAHDAFVCAALAEAGVLGAEAIIEGKLGLLQAYTDRDRSEVDWHRLIADLGHTWEWTATSLKPWPACRMTHGMIEVAGELGRDSWERTQSSSARARRVKKITVKMAQANMILVGQPTRNKIHPENIVDAQFSMYFQTANAWCYGAAMDVSAYSRLADPRIHDLCDRIECVRDETCQKMGAKMEVEFENNESVTKVCEFPLGEKEHPFSRELVEEKFLSLMVPVYGEKSARTIMDRVDSIESGSLADLMALLAA